MTELEAVKRKPNQETIDGLKSLLAEAEAGEIQGFWAALNYGEASGPCMYGDFNGLQVRELERIKLRYLIQTSSGDDLAHLSEY